MVETGGSIFIAMSLAIMLMSLLPVCIIFIRKVPAQAILNVLVILCLFVFARYLILSFIQPGSLTVQTGFRLAEFALSFYLLKQMLISNRGKDVLNMLLVSFLSVVITIYSLKGILAFTQTLTVIQAVILMLLAFIILIQLVHNRQITLINEADFWVAGGLLCYYGMVVLMEALTEYDSGLSQQIQQQKDLVLMGAEIIRLAFFSVAAVVIGNRQS